MRELDLAGAPDAELLRALARYGLDALISLDNNRQPEVWADLMRELAEGRGRLIRIKTTNREVPTLANLTRYLVKSYERLEGVLNDPKAALVQIGHEITSRRPVVGGFRTYTRQEVGQLVQQSFGIAPDDSFRVRGTPRIDR